MERKKTSLVIIGVCILVLSAVGVTYAFWQLILAQTDSDTIASSCFEVDLINEKDAIQLDKAYPIEDTERKTLTPYKFTITNTCNANASYQINLEALERYDTDITIAAEIRLNPEYIRAQLNEVEVNEEETEMEKEIVNLDSSIQVAPTINDEQAKSYDAYKLATGYLGPNESKRFALRIWLDGDLTMEDTDAMNKTFASKITVIASYLSEAQMKPQVDLELALCENNIIVQGKVTPFGDREVSTYQFQLDTNEWESGNSLTKSYSVDPGSHTVSLKVTDSEGMTNEITRTVNVDYEEPKTVNLGGQTIDLVSEGNGLYKVGHCGLTGTVDDDTFSQEEYRYAGVNYSEGSEDYVHNYVDIEGQIWRIIGLVNTPEGQRIKLIKDESIGMYSWDTSSKDINNGKGVNEWSESDLMKLLNPDYESNYGSICTYDDFWSRITCDGTSGLVNNSLYWTGESGKCYNKEENVADVCDFSENKIPDNLKNMIDTITWNTGSNGNDYSYNEINANNFYQIERSSNTGKICDSSNINCNDTVERETSWKGKVGLMYPSDYAYATSGGSAGRTACFAKELNSWNSMTDCVESNWLAHTKSYTFTISPCNYAYYASALFGIYNDSNVSYTNVYNGRYDVYPSVYLLPSVKLSGTGTYNDMFTLSLE